MPPGDIAPVLAMFLFTFGVGAVIVLRGPLGKALARRLEGPPALPDASAQQLDDLHLRMAELEVQVGRMHELEERLDFAERLLAQGRAEPSRIEAGRIEGDALTRVERIFGIDGVDLLIHAGVTFAVMAVGASLWSHEDAEVMLATVSGISLVVLGIRRRLALKHRVSDTTGEMAAVRIAEVEVRLADVEQMHNRILELEERVDFTERLLASQREQSHLPR